MSRDLSEEHQHFKYQCCVSGAVDGEMLKPFCVNEDFHTGVCMVCVFEGGFHSTEFEWKISI